MNKLFAALMRLRVLALLTVLLAALFGAPASSCSQWDHCSVTQRYGQNEEHGADLWTQGLPVTALRSGTITFSHEECWNGESDQDEHTSPHHQNGGRPGIT